MTASVQLCDVCTPERGGVVAAGKEWWKSKTAPAGRLSPFAEACGSSVQSLEVIRGDPCRKNLSISVTRLRDGDAGTLLVEVVKVVQESLKARLSNAMERC